MPKAPASLVEESKLLPGDAALDGAKPVPVKSGYRLFGTLRFVLAMFVVIGHMVVLAPVEVQRVIVPLALSQVGVFMFFVLSGYVIAEANESFYVGQGRRFLINRGLRIIPPYYAALLVSLLLHAFVSWNTGLRFYVTPAPRDIFATANVIGNFANIVVWHGLSVLKIAPHYLFVNYIWALVVEMKFYVAAALLFWLAGRKNVFLQRYGLALGFCFFIALHLWAVAEPTKYSHDLAFIPYFSFGMCLYYALEKRSQGALIGAVLSLVLVLSHYVARLAYPEADVEVTRVHADFNVVASSLLLFLLYLSLIPLSKVQITPRLKAVDRFLGDVTYSLYLNHFVVLIVFLSYFPKPSSVVYLAAMLSAVIFSYGMNFLTEPYTRLLRDRVRGRAL